MSDKEGLSRSFHVRKTLLAMLRDRGFDVPEALDLPMPAFEALYNPAKCAHAALRLVTHGSADSLSFTALKTLGGAKGRVIVCFAFDDKVLDRNASPG